MKDHEWIFHEVPIGKSLILWQDSDREATAAQALRVGLVLAHRHVIIRRAQMSGGGDAIGEVIGRATQQSATEWRQQMSHEPGSPPA